MQYLLLQVVYFTVSFSYLLLIIIFIRAVTLPGAGEGLKYYLIPDFSRLGNLDVRTVYDFLLFLFLTCRGLRLWSCFCVGEGAFPLLVDVHTWMWFYKQSCSCWLCLVQPINTCSHEWMSQSPIYTLMAQFGVGARGDCQMFSMIYCFHWLLVFNMQHSTFCFFHWTTVEIPIEIWPASVCLAWECVCFCHRVAVASSFERLMENSL